MDSQQDENDVPRLPFGKSLRLLILGSNLSAADFRFVLNKRGIYIKDGRRENTIPNLANILLSPREFDILKNRQQFRESTVKVSDALSAWNSQESIQQVLPDEIEPFVQDLITENSPYQLTQCNLQINDANDVVINFTVKRQDWTKDAFSSVSHHDGKFTISKDHNGVVTYRSEATSSETKELLIKLQSATHEFFQRQGAIATDSPVQKVLALYFSSYASIFDFLNCFAQQTYNALTFERISDIDVGIDQKYGSFPPNFEWLKGNIDKITLHGNKIHTTDVMKLGEVGILIFGEIEADFKFDFAEAKGNCTIRYGFPGYYEGKSNVEFEAKVIRVAPYAAYAHIPKERISRQIVQEFQQNKHELFEQFIDAGKAIAQKRNAENQFEFDGLDW